MAASRVFGITELTVHILDRVHLLDLISLQRVNTTFLACIREAPTLRKRLWWTEYEGPAQIFETGHRPYDDSVDGPWPMIHDTITTYQLHPLMDWFATRAFYKKEAASPRVTTLHPAAIVFNFLPHALRAAKQPHSSLYNFQLTSPPVKRVELLFYEPGERIGLTYITKMTGVTLGDLLQTWAGPGNSAMKGMPIGLNIERADDEPRGKSRFSCIDLVARLWGEMNLMADPHSADGGSYWGFEVSAPWYIEWARGAAGAGSDWMSVSKREQDKKVVELLMMRHEHATEDEEHTRDYLPWLSTVSGDALPAGNHMEASFANGLELTNVRPPSTPTNTPVVGRGTWLRLRTKCRRIATRFKLRRST